MHDPFTSDSTVVPQFFSARKCKCDPKPRSSGQWTFAVRNLECNLGAKIHDITTTINYSFCLDHTSHHTKVMGVT